MSGNTSSQLMKEAFAEVMSLPGRISKMEGEEGWFVVEDITGRPMAFIPDERLARLFFAAPGMLQSLGGLGEVLSALIRECPDIQPPLADRLLMVLEEANLALEGASETVISQENIS